MATNSSAEYVYVIEQAEDGTYWAYLPDLPGCTSAADTIQDLEPRIKEAVDLYLSHYRERGEPPPKPSARVGRVVAA